MFTEKKSSTNLPFSSTFSRTTSSLRDRSLTQRYLSSFQIGNIKNKVTKFLPIIILVLIVLVLLFWAKNTIQPNSIASDDRAVLKGPRASEVLNKDFSFPIKDEKGAEITKFKYNLESGELRDEILVKSQRVVAVKGKIFLILNIKITNPYSQAIDVNAKDFVRLAVNANDQEKMAADIHSDPVTVQAISTKLTRLGFPINDGDRNLTLYVGELKGDKTKIDLKLQ
ncbi:hypothetical protein HY407_04615 [Candidatus Gottesmanbacteria bacterium]|nr:hypothetical protein [Candidatus Gottesmanbacteria bacterium]